MIEASDRLVFTSPAAAEFTMERYAAGEAYVIPIILRPVYWQGALFGKLQALPTDAKPVTSPKWHNLDEAFFDDNVRRGFRPGSSHGLQTIDRE